MDLVHCIYCSAAVNPVLTRADLADLLAKARTKNASLGVTGMLLFHDGVFFQVLEGDRPTVEALYATIEADARHRRVTRLIIEPIEERAFAEWTMGFSAVTYKELSEVPGLNDFFGKGQSFLSLGEGRAKTLLRAFKDGRWRLTLA